jgi:ribosomal protein L39E
MTHHYPKKVKLAVQGRRTKWAPFWAVIRKFGQGFHAHPSQITKQRRNWRRIKLKIKPRKIRKQHLG